MNTSASLTMEYTGRKSTPLEGYKKIKVPLIFNVKHDGGHKARCVGDGHLINVPIDSVYSGVVSFAVCVIA